MTTRPTNQDYDDAMSIMRELEGGEPYAAAVGSTLPRSLRRTGSWWMSAMKRDATSTCSSAAWRAGHELR